MIELSPMFDQPLLDFVGNFKSQFLFVLQSDDDVDNQSPPPETRMHDDYPAEAVSSHGSERSERSASPVQELERRGEDTSDKSDAGWFELKLYCSVLLSCSRMIDLVFLHGLNVRLFEQFDFTGNVFATIYFVGFRRESAGVL
jgi:hypothetical protein